MRRKGSGIEPKYITSESNEICKRNVMLSFEVPYVSSGELKSLGFGRTEYEDCVRMVQACSPSVLHAKSMKYAKEMLCYLLKFPRFEVVN